MELFTVINSSITDPPLPYKAYTKSVQLSFFEHSLEFTLTILLIKKIHMTHHLNSLFSLDGLLSPLIK